MAKGTGSPAAQEVFADSYRIVRSLGEEGGPTKLYRAEQTSTERPCALRVFDATFVATAEGKKRFDELRALRTRIRTDHLVDLQAAGVDAATGSAWFALDWVDGKTLEDYAAEPLEDDDTLEILSQVARGLEAVHGADAVFGDLRPGSVMVTEPRRRSGTPKVTLLDFWTLPWTEEEESEGEEDDDEAVLWRAPEQLQGDAKVGPAADVWAFGLLAFRLVTGQIFWRAAEDESADAEKEVTRDPIPKASVRAEELGIEPGLSADFDRWFARCVTRTVGDRFKTVDEAVEALAPILEADEEEEEEAPPPPVKTPAGRGRGKAAAPPPPPPPAASPFDALPAWMRKSDFAIPAVLVTAIVVLFAVRATMHPTPATPASTAPTAAPLAVDPTVRPAVLTEGGAQSIEATLSASDRGSPVWIAVAAVDPSAEALGTRLNAIFEHAGWQTHPIQHPTMRARPGIFIFAESESPPPYLETVQRALGAGGLRPSTASGYRAYLAERRQQDPTYQGFTFDDGQTYVIVVGRGE